MLRSLVKVFGGDPNKRDIRRFSETVEYINSLEPGFRALSDAELRAKTDEFRARLAGGETPDDLLPEAFASVREAAMRTLGQRHYDVQLIGGIVIHQGKIAEMRTGEGKTLVATLPIYLNALEGRGVHLITVNDYLARRDARWMGALFNFLGLSVGVLQEAARTEHGKKAFLVDFEHESPQEDQNHLHLVDRRLAYAADITYGTNNEFGFDYLRDNMAMRLADRVQRERHYAIVDEIDNILIDEARTPLIISGPSHEDSGNYVRMAQVVKQLDRSDFEINERDRTISLTEQGEEHVAELLGQPLYDPDRPEDITPEQAQTLGFLEQALRAEYLFKRNKDYLVQGGKVVIVDEFTGRLMHGRRWSDGLHQAVEAKEGVKVQEENVTYATITLQNYFRLYGKLAGMTGTALTEAEEFSKIYKLDVVPIPPNLEYMAARPESGLTEVEFRENGSKFHYYARREDPTEGPIFWKRKDYADQVYRTEEAKLRSICTEILRRHALGQPLLVGTTSVENSDLISRRLKPDPLRRLVQTLLLRDAWFEFHQQEEDGRMVEELLPLNERLEDLNSSDMRNLAKELGLNFNPEEPENLERLARVLYLSGPDESDAWQVAGDTALSPVIPSPHQGDPRHPPQRLLEALRGGVRHQVLNARKHDEESQIIAGAGALGAVTIATNMAGRGVDIKLGGELAEEVLTEVNRVLRRVGVADPYNMTMAERLDALDHVTDEQIGIYGAEIAFFRQHMADEARVRQAGGLHVVGTERHEARRIDNQLRGRAARQGDPGSSQFYLSLGDELMRRFGGSQVSDLMQRLKIDDAVPVAHGIVNKTIEQSQTRVEGANFDVRKHLLEYDDVLNTQRNKIYEQRDRIFTKEALDEDIETMLAAEVERHVRSTVAGEGWKLLAWLEEIQPSLPIGEDRLYPSYMLRLLRDTLAAAKTREAALAGLLQIAREALEAEREHLMHLVEEQIDRSAERSKQIIRERREMVELAIEGVDAEARESDQTVDPQKMAEAVSQATGMELSLDRKTLREAAGDLRSFKATLLELAETNAVHNVWDALVAGVVRRLGVPLNLPRPEGPRVDWQAGGDRLLQAVESAHAERTRQVEVEIERQVGELLDRTVEITPDLLTRLLIEMAFGTLMLFDRQTHQRRALRTRRLTYVYSVARKLDGRDPQALTEEILDHLKGAQKALAQIWGEAELARHAKAGLRMADLPQRALDRLKAASGDSQWDDAASSPLGTLHGELRERVIEELGRESLNEIYRQLMLSVSGQLWVEYLTQVEALRTSIGLEAYGQRDPLVQYKSKAFDLFQELLVNMRGGVVSRLFAFRPQAPAMLDRPAPRAGVPATTAPRGVAGASRPAAGNGDTRGGAGPPPNLGRNDECWCGSGKKYKHCHYDSDRAQQPAPVAARNLPTSEVVEGARKRRRRKKR